ncbi:GrpB family protein [Alicyclobacillus sp. ALC3]|uniref:GrpB family protein n=1 Tax=Alicyclobacillus sp. ALC3 TaxID=2796143 RepID=UPI0023793322|nr:GrpB family protein [Alicyclobacillus sp. ALC3]
MAVTSEVINLEDANKTRLPAWATEAVKIENYDLNWISQGIHEVQELLSLLSSFGVDEVEHIGSTSIPALPSKPILDLMASIASYDRISELTESLETHHWYYVPPELDNRAWRRFFIKVENNKRVAHLHLMLKGEPRWEQQLQFRDRLKRNPALISDYANLKRDLAAKFGNDREAYSKSKAAFIEHVLRM